MVATNLLMRHIGKVIFVLSLLAFLLMPVVGYAQTRTVTVQGLWEMANITPEQARLLALENAKENALREAGVAEDFIVINTGTISDKINSFVSFSNSELQGEIIDYEILDEGIRSQQRRHFYEIAIEAKVRTGKVKHDPEFDLFINGIKNTPYRDGEMFLFSIRPSKDGYITLFWVDEQGNGACIFPNEAETSERFLAGETYIFPRTQSYKARKETEAPVETVSLIYVFTKRNIPFTEECDLEAIQRWSISIPSDTRVVKYKTISISH